MTAQPPKEKAEISSKSTEGELSKCGTSRVSTDHTNCGSDKLTDLQDAVTQAKRELEAGKP